MINLIRGALEAESGFDQRQVMRNLTQLERNAARFLSRSITLPEEKSDPFGKESQSLKEPEAESPAETVEEEPKRSYRRYSRKSEEESEEV